MRQRERGREKERETEKDRERQRESETERGRERHRDTQKTQRDIEPVLLHECPTCSELSCNVSTVETLFSQG